MQIEKNPAPVDADTLLADRTNSLHAGTHVVAGRGRAVVTATGSRTEVGKVALLAEGATEPKTPLERRIAQLGRVLVASAIGLSIDLLLRRLERHPRVSWSLSEHG